MYIHTVYIFSQRENVLYTHVFGGSLPACPVGGRPAILGDAGAAAGGGARAPGEAEALDSRRKCGQSSSARKIPEVYSDLPQPLAVGKTPSSTLRVSIPLLLEDDLPSC